MSSESQLSAAAAAAAAASASRVSVACLPCRSRHARCDARQPVCARCLLEGRTCEYVKSRRGGLNRARLAERRHARDSALALPAAAIPAPVTRLELKRGNQISTEPISAITPTHSALSEESGTMNREASGSGTPDRPISNDVLFSSVTDDRLVNLFYKHFHRCHPCALPQHKLQQFYGETPGQEILTLLIAVMRFIGSLYNADSITQSTPQLEVKVTEGFQAVNNLPPDPFLVQCHLFYSIALYWNNDKAKSRGEIDAAIRIALGLGMNHRQFATDYACGDTVLQECLRRTWWQLYCIDAYFAAIKRSPTFALCEVDVDTELPCEEDEYETGLIPTPKTLDDFDWREFAPENQVFSSFAYLIGATRSIALSLSAGSPDSSNWFSTKVIAEIDAIIDSWFLLLPKSKKEILKEGSVLDELMFQAHMAVHANLIALHRPFSKLPFHPLEGISSCLVKPPERVPVGDSEAVHTQRCLQSIEAQLQFLVLPAPPFHRSPFTICMTAAGTHTLLSAIKVLFSGRQLVVARHQLRLVIGYIKALAKVWPQGGKNLDEITTIAREVLSKKSDSGHQIVAHKNTAISQPLLAPVIEPATGIEGLDGWGNLAMTMETQGGTEPYWNFGNELQSDIPVWFDSY